MQARALKTIVTLAVAAMAATAAVQPCGAGTPGASTNIAVSGEAPAVCSMAGANAAFMTGAMAFDELIDPRTALVKGAAAQLHIANAMCNFSAQITLTSNNGGMAYGNSAVVPYTLVLNWNGVSVTLDTSRAKSVQQQTYGALRGPLTLNFNTPKTRTPVAKGPYKDTVTVKVGGVM